MTFREKLSPNAPVSGTRPNGEKHLDIKAYLFLNHFFIYLAYKLLLNQKKDKLSP